MEEKYYLKSIFNEDIGCQEIFIAEKTTDKLIDKKEAVELLNGYEQNIKELIEELQKQLEASETQNKRVLEKLELITKSNQELENNNRIGKEAYKYLRKEYNERVEENKQAHILNDGLGERIEHLEQQLKAQPAEIVDEIKKQITNTHCYGLRINRIFEILDDILKEYQR